MAKGKLLSALDRQKGRNIKLEKQREQEKAAAKKRAAKAPPPVATAAIENDENDEFNAFDSDSDSDADSDAMSQDNEPTGGVPLAESIAALARGIAADAADVNGGDGEQDDDEDDEDEDPEAGDAIPFSDLESLGSDAKADVVPFQRLTINNTTALLKAHRALTSDRSTSFSEHQVVTSAAQVEISDVHDDLGRELAFYKQNLEAATEGRARLRQAGIPFSRPTDYFAEMVKTDEHMEKIRAKLTEKESDKKASAEARRLRDLKKFGKQVQVAKQQERDKAKRDTLDKINQLKRKRNASSGDTREEDLFDVALEDEGKKKPERKRKAKNEEPKQPNFKRQSKNEKYGQGGRKRFKKSGDAVSSGDLSGFSTKRMKAQTKGSKRLGKSRRGKQ